MTPRRTGQWLLLLGLVFVIGAPAATLWDADKERAIADKLGTQLEYGELIWLQTDNGSEFPGIYTLPVSGTGQRSVILLHSMSAHMDWPVVIAPLRVFLRERTWSSFSIQLPVIATGQVPSGYGKTLAEASGRISSAVRYLRDHGHDTVVLIGYGFGATTAACFLTEHQAHGVRAFVGISMLARKYLAPDVNLLDYIKGLNLPTLDVYGSGDLPVIVRSADDRRLYSQKNGTYRYSQIIIEGADHYYTGQEQTLFNRIIVWLEDVMSGTGEHPEYPAVQGNETSRY